jgi:acetyl esterase
VSAFRQGIRSFAGIVGGPTVTGVSVSSVRVDGAAGLLDARLYSPAADVHSVRGACLVYFHGGGWTGGDLDTHDQPCRLIARSAGASVLSVAYRLAPEHPFPAPVDDAFAAFRYVASNAARFGFDPHRLAVGGDSAGGNLAAVVAQQCAREGGPAPAVQALIYPATDCAHESPSRRNLARGYALDRDELAWCEAQLLGATASRRDVRVSPLLADTLTDCAPALVVTAGFDVLRDEGEAYAHRLSDAGVPAVLRRYSGFMHGFVQGLAAGSSVREAVVEIGAMLRAMLCAARPLDPPMGRASPSRQGW